MKRVAIALAMLLGMQLAHAEERGGKRIPSDATWEKECSGCHVAYPSNLLTADDWKKVMGSLDKHFGSNAELDAKDRKTIEDYLVRNAGTGARHSSTTLRITDTSWFKREHRDISAKEWVHPEVKSPSNCNACHKIVTGYPWSEHDIHMPRGMRWEGDDDDD